MIGAKCFVSRVSRFSNQDTRKQNESSISCLGSNESEPDNYPLVGKKGEKKNQASREEGFEDLEIKRFESCCRCEKTRKAGFDVPLTAEPEVNS